MFGSLPERLAFLWAVDPAEADSFRVVIVQDFDGVAVENRDDWVVKPAAKEKHAARKVPKALADPYSDGTLNEMEKKNARIQLLEEAVRGPLIPRIDWVNNPSELS